MSNEIPQYLNNVLKYAKLEQVLLLVLLAFISLDYFGLAITQASIILFSTVSMGFVLIGKAVLAGLKSNFIAKLFIYTHYYGAAILGIGLLFKLQYYPGYVMMINIGMIAFSSSLIMLFFPKIQEQFLPKIKPILLRFLVLITWSLYLLVQ